MYSFVFLAIPSVLIWFLSRHSTYSFKSSLPPLLIGLFTGVVICCVKEFVIFSNYYTSSNFIVYSLHNYLYEILIPCAVSLALFFLLSKDTREYKVKMIFTLLAATYISLLPYTTIAGEDKHSAFMLIAKPFLIIAMITYVSIIAEKNFIEIKNRQTVIFSSMLIFILTLIPCIIMSIWFYKISAILTAILVISYFTASLFLFFKRIKCQK